MDWFHLITALLLLNLGFYGCAADDAEPTCGKSNVGTNRIAGGHEATKGEFPWQVAVWLPGKMFCGGTLLSNTWVLTSAQCLDGHNASSVVVILGSIKLSGNPKEETAIPAKRIIIHPYYYFSNYSGDLALIELEKPVDFTTYITPLCLPPPTVTFTPGQLCYVAGWGQKKFNDSEGISDVLRGAEVRLITSELCQDYYNMKNDYNITGDVITNDTICARDIHGVHRICRGDGGGPLACPAGNSWYVVGVASFVVLCGEMGHPGVYTSVPYYMDWIQEYVSSAAGRIGSGMELNPLSLMSFVQSLCWMLIRDPWLVLSVSAATWLGS
ncbi:serine protease 27 [Xenopus tropicalis]|uniref:Serine protease 27 n=3 Tax=Xenopus tropicalis TaxID=8364 RepID=A0A803J7K2_XENTR|nr:serine protease 27 [Xenopus tropicalis]|eukprot:XP_002941509.1 PREDICTED: serine protease 27 [Xenopus tropicalis]